MVVPQYCSVDIAHGMDVPELALTSPPSPDTIFTTTSADEENSFANIMRFLVENQAIPEVKQVLDDGIRAHDTAQEDTSVHLSTIPASWVLELAPDGQVDAFGNRVDDRAPGFIPAFRMICHFGDDCQLEARSIGPPSSDALLQFIERCLAEPMPPHPRTLHLRGFTLAAYPAVRAFLAHLPAPLEIYEPQMPDTADTDSSALLARAERLKEDASAALKRRDRPAAVAAYAGAIRCAQAALAAAAPADDPDDLHRILAILYTNRGIVHLAGDGLVAALYDGERAEAADPGYAKGYHLQARALLLLGDIGAAREAVERGLRYPGMCADSQLQDALAVLWVRERRLLGEVTSRRTTSNRAGSGCH